MKYLENFWPSRVADVMTSLSALDLLGQRAGA